MPVPPSPPSSPAPAPSDPRATFAALDPALPLTLLPVRLETRFFLGHQPPELRIRIFPDAIHADGHRDALLRSEQSAGRAFWARALQAPGDAATRDAAFAWLCGRFGPWRAAWVASALRPTVAKQGDPPRFPAVPTLVPGAPTWARLLPERFAAVLLAGEQRHGPWWSVRLRDQVPLAPGAADTGELGAREWLTAQGLDWVHDFDAAERAGLGIRIDLSEFSATQRAAGFEELLVLGVRAGDQQQAVEHLLRAHRYTHGLDLIPAGTPTNATDSSGPGLSLDAPDLSKLCVTELDTQPDGSRPPLRHDGDLYRQRAADSAAIALGLGGPSALDRSAHARQADLPRALAMNRALWPALGGYYADHLLGGVLGDEARAWTRDWGMTFARGGGPLPTLLVGAQPYGLLPVSRVRAVRRSPDAPMIARLERLLIAVNGHWDTAAVPRLQRDAADAALVGDARTGELAAVVSQVLAAVPHLTALHLQPADAHRQDYLDDWSARLFMLGLACGLFPDATGMPAADYHGSVLWPLLESLQSGLDAARDPAAQMLVVQAFENGLWPAGGTDTQQQYRQRWRDYADDALATMLAEHALRVEPLLELLPSGSAVTGLLGEPAEPNAFFALYPDAASRDWELPLVAPGRTADDLGGLRTWLKDLADHARERFGAPDEHTVPRSLLETLLRWSIEQATDAGDQAVVLAGLAGLEDTARGSSDPVGELERLLRETLGVMGYRLDAWYTAVAAWRLEQQRRTNADGVQVGAYAFIEDLRPNSAERASQGYVLAPSLTHATTAAILRGGWAAFGGAGQSGALAVDLSAPRVRRARWLIDGVRQGQDLARLIGARFERSLHDAGLDHWIDDFRRLALDATGGRGRTTAIIDGLLLARARLGPEDMSDAETAAQKAIDSLLASADGEQAGIEDALDSLAADLDAVADAAVAQGVFSLAQGNDPEASATLTAAATGDGTFPHLRVADTPRQSQAVTHRLLALLDAGAEDVWGDAPAGGRALAAPSVESWLASLLGEPAGWRFVVRFVDPDGGGAEVGATPATLADVGLAALDVVFLAAPDEQTGLGRFGAVLALWGQGHRPPGLPATAVATIDPGTGDGSLSDLVVMARALRGLLAKGRDLDGRDLAAPGVTGVLSGVDADELAARTGRAQGALVAARAGLAAALGDLAGGPPRGDLLAALLGFRGFQLATAVPPPGADLVAQGGELLAEVDARVAAFDARVDGEAAGWDTLDADGRAAALAGRLALLVGNALPLAPRFTAADPAGLDATFARGRLAGRQAATAWLAAAGRVDPGARGLRVAIDLAEAARDAVLFDFTLGQLPDHDGEGWAAVERPTADDRSRLCLLATGPAGGSFAGPVAGLVLGSWTEAIPAPSQDAAMALHFDAPSARAPQAILLCAADPEDGYAFEAVRDVVEQTFDLARRRMVGPETLDGLGQYLPAAYLPDDVTPVGT